MGLAADSPQPLALMGVYVADVHFEDMNVAKWRPVVLVQIREKTVGVFRITSQYADKSDRIRKVYYPMANSDEAGLKEQSYIDVHTLQLFDRPAFMQTRRIGTLTAVDQTHLARFIQQHAKDIERMHPDYEI